MPLEYVHCIIYYDYRNDTTSDQGIIRSFVSVETAVRYKGVS